VFIRLKQGFAGLQKPSSQRYVIMAQPRIVFEPSASDPQRDVVKEIVNRRNITLPVATNECPSLCYEMVPVPLKYRRISAWPMSPTMCVTNLAFIGFAAVPGVLR
jgi:hypothetical protein